MGLGDNFEHLPFFAWLTPRGLEYGSPAQYTSPTSSKSLPQSLASLLWTEALQPGQGLLLLWGAWGGQWGRARKCHSRTAQAVAVYALMPTMD